MQLSDVSIVSKSLKVMVIIPNTPFSISNTHLMIIH